MQLMGARIVIIGTFRSTKMQEKVQLQGADREKKFSLFGSSGTILSGLQLTDYMRITHIKLDSLNSRKNSPSLTF